MGSGFILIRDSGQVVVYVVYVWVVYDCDSNETLKSIFKTFSNTFFGAKFELRSLMEKMFKLLGNSGHFQCLKNALF